MANLKILLQGKRENAEAEFLAIYSKAIETMEKHHIVPAMPRITGTQRNRANTPADSPEQYFKRTIFFPMIDQMLTDLSTRFDRHTLNCFQLFNLLPKNVAERTSAALIETISVLHTKYGELVGCKSEVRMKGKILGWQQQCKNTASSGKDFPKSILEAIDTCDIEIYPIVNQLLRILGTLPASVASAERSFSCLKRLKTWLRTRMTQTRMTGLALLSINRDINVQVSEIIDCFAKGKRRLDSLFKYLFIYIVKSCKFKSI